MLNENKDKDKSEWLFNVPYNALRCMGIRMYYKYESDKSFKFVISQTIVLAINILVFLMEVLFCVFTEVESITIYFLALPVLVAELNAQFDFAFICLYKKEMTMIIRQLSEMYHHLKTDQIFTEQYICRMRRFILTFLGIFSLTSSLFNFIPIISTWLKYYRYQIWEPALPFLFWYPFDPYEYFTLNYIFQVYAGIMGSMIKIIPECFLVLMLTQINMQFHALGKDFTETVNEIASQNSNGESLNDSKQKLKKLIQRHQVLLE